MKPQVTLLLAEGDTDITTLVPALNTYFEAHSRRLDHAEPFRCDVTTIRLFSENARDAGILKPDDDIRRIVSEHVQAHIKDSPFKPSCYTHVVQVIDLDGAFIPTSLILEDGNAYHIRYTESNIISPNRMRTIQVLSEKQRQIGKLLSDKPLPVGGRRFLPYRLFFMSRNLEHALSGRHESLTEKQKANIAATRAIAYANNSNLLMRNLLALYAMNRPSGVQRPDWSQTWDYVREGKNSLMRNSNLILMPQFVFKGV